MSEISVVVDRTVKASPEATFGALADYAAVRPTILPPQITDFQVLDGGVGSGTRFSYNLHATKKRIRHVEAQVSEPQAGRELLETDGNSSLTVIWDVAPSDHGGSRVTVRVTWQGAAGIGGFFERTFAPAGIQRIYNAELDRLESVLV
jgi:hypothetical protein